MKKIILWLILALPVPAFAQSASTDCLVDHWTFTGKVNEEGGNGNEIISHGPTLTTDRFGNENSAYYFDGIDDYMEVADATSFGFEGDGTISFWVKQDGDIGTVLWKRQYSGSFGWTIYYGYSNSIIGYVNDNATYVRGATQSDLWQHIAMVSDAGTMRLYINGNLVDSKTNTAGFQKTTTPLWIGKDENGNYFKGTIDDVSIYHCALTSQEILSLYDRTPACLVADLSFNGNAIDESGEGNTCTLYGPTLTTDRFGNENSAYYFDGIDDYMEVADATSLGFEGDGTISFWVKQDGDIGTVLWKRQYSGSFGWTIYYGYSNSIIGYVNDNATYVRGATQSDLWQHIAVVSDAGTMRLYINGNLVDSKTNTAGFQKSTTPLWIGKDENGNYFKGTIDDVSIYHCVLTNIQIQENYNPATTLNTSQENMDNGFSVYPNPVKDKIMLKNSKTSNDEMNITLLNGSGERMLFGSYKNNTVTEINVSDYPQGIYLLIVQTGNTMWSKKIIVN